MLLKIVNHAISTLIYKEHIYELKFNLIDGVYSIYLDGKLESTFDDLKDAYNNILDSIKYRHSNNKGEWID